MEPAAGGDDFHRPGPPSAGVDLTRVEDLMTPVIFAVAPATPVRDVIRQMLDLGVHRLFVVDPDGVLVGVVSATDVLRRLH